MRLLIFLGILQIVHAAKHGPEVPSEDAEALYKQLESKLVDAKSVRVKFKILKSKPTAMAWEGDLLLIKDSNKVFFRLRDGKGVRPEKNLICDGRQIMVRGFEPDWNRWRSEKAPPKLDREVAYGMARLGLHAGMDWPGAARRGWDVLRTIELSEFSLKAKEKVGDQTAQAIAFRFAYSETKKPWPPATLWINEASHLPLKLTRTIEGELVDDVTEIYETIDLDQPLADKDFELPQK
jgi:hypothetical protein